LTLGGVSSASLNKEHDINADHNDVLTPNNLVKNPQHAQKIFHPTDRSKTTLNNQKLLKKRIEQPLLHDDKEDLYSMLHEKDSTMTQNKYSPVMKSTKEELLEEEEERINNIKLYTLLLIPWIIYPASKASYFTLLELFNAYGMSQGVPAESAFIFQVIAQCVDFVALTRGRFKFIEGGMNNLQQEMLDYFLTKAGVPDPHKLGVQILLPASDWPEYEQKKK
jgi:hypothetical protein